jgi:hypothetical protein
MRTVLFTIVSLTLLQLMSCDNPEMKSESYEVVSPSGEIALEVWLNADQQVQYLVKFQDQIVIDSSGMGFEFLDQEAFGTGLSIESEQQTTVNETWEMPWGEQREVVNHYTESVIKVREVAAPNRQCNLYFRAYDDGIAFRYEFPEQEGWREALITEELTEFQLTGDHTCWWIPGDWDIYEHLYNTTAVSGIDALSKRDHPNLAQTTIPHNAVNTPVTMRTAEGIHLSFHEANLTDYSGMTLAVDTENLRMNSMLVGSANQDYKVKRSLPFATPWRTIQISPDAAGLLNSRLIVNLNEPSRLDDISWFTPMKYVGIWWEMHLGKSSWDLASGKHGATTENTKAHIDFAAENGIGGVLVEGWNTGWERWIGFEDREGVFDFITPYPDYDLEEVVRYADEKGVQIIMHHETSAAPRTYEQQLDTAYALMQRLGIHSVKTGYVGKIIPAGEYHHGQWMVNHYRKVLETGAQYQVAINAHEPIKDTGLRRTYPNAISREGLRGQEFNAWASDGGNPPEHLPIVAFTRMLAGPIDFTPGVFDIKMDAYKENNQVNTTLAQQLALYVVIYSPIQMACDLLEHYENQPGFQFIRDVGVDWEQSIVLDGEVGDFVAIAREERGTENWFVGAISDENPRDLSIDFSFLDADATYRAVIYKDGPDAHWDRNPLPLTIEEVMLESSSTMTFRLAAGGGLAISLEKTD